MLPTTVTTVPVELPEHLMHRKSDIPMYASAQTEHTILEARPSHQQRRKSPRTYMKAQDTVNGAGKESERVNNFSDSTSQPRRAVGTQPVAGI